MGKLSRFKQSKFLRSAQIDKPYTLKMAGIRNEVIDETEGKEGPVLYFAGTSRGMVLNATNLYQLIDLYGDDDEAIKGQMITIWVDPSVTFGGKRVGGLRLRAPDAIPQQPKPSMPPDDSPMAGAVEESPETPDDIFAGKDDDPPF